MARNKSAANDDGNEKIGEIVASYVYFGQLMRGELEVGDFSDMIPWLEAK
jgi:hypothetical protein